VGIKKFPKDKIVVNGGTLTQEENWFNISIPVAPFPLGGETVATSFELESIDFGTQNIVELASNTFTFPVNPEEGYIDGSIYLANVHNPADVTEIAFGPYNDSTISATITLRILFSFEGHAFQDTDLVLNTLLKVAE